MRQAREGFTMVTQRTIGKTNIRTSAIGIGGNRWIDALGVSDRDALEMIHTAIDRGINFIDTAPLYGLGHSEKLIGKVLPAYRQRVVLATKCGPQWMVERGSLLERESAFVGRLVYNSLRPEDIRRQLEESLKRLQTDYIDLYQAHYSEDEVTSTEEVMETLLALKQEGKIRAIGLCNTTLEQYESYSAYGMIDSMQEEYNMLNKSIEANIIPRAMADQVSVLAYRPLVFGLLTGKMDTNRALVQRDPRSHQAAFSLNNREQVTVLTSALQELADKHRATIAQIVIAWTLSQQGISFVLCGASTPKQVIENAQSGNIHLDASDEAYIQLALEKLYGSSLSDSLEKDKDAPTLS